MMDIAALHGSFVADMTYMDFTSTDYHGDGHPFFCYRLVSPPQTHVYRLQLCLHRRVRGPAPRAYR